MEANFVGGAGTVSDSDDSIITVYNSGYNEILVACEFDVGKQPNHILDFDIGSDATSVAANAFLVTACLSTSLS